MTKSELAKLVLSQEEYVQLDMALPQSFVDQMRLDHDIDVRPYWIWCYDQSVFGRPVNLAERFFAKYQLVPEMLQISKGVISDFKEKNVITDDDNLPERYMLLNKYIILMEENIKILSSGKIV